MLQVREGKLSCFDQHLFSCRGERRFEKSARRDGGMESGKGGGLVLKVLERWGED